VQKILDQFVASGELQSKEYGKAVIYFCNQTKLEEDVGTVTKENVNTIMRYVSSQVAAWSTLQHQAVQLSW
jgi:TBPIP/Hop2 winged helix domain